ncbi:MAG: TolC family outer membrane protein [Hahellaceae bacterium]|nr:TolC family outer membrane protein [Hahellaceae bacterium]
MKGVAQCGFVLSMMASSVMAATLSEEVETAINRNPEVQASWHAFTSAREEQRVARGGYYPRLDLSAGVGYEYQRSPNSADLDFGRQGASVSLTQMIYDGWQTPSEVGRLHYGMLSRYHALLDTTDDISLEASKAYLDVLRYRALVALAESNYQQHQKIFAQISERVGSGFGRGADLDQAKGRLALAESNVRTEILNLHGVESRYLRLIGHLPSDSNTQPVLDLSFIPATLEETLASAFQSHNGFNAAIETVRSAEADSEGKDAPFKPRLDLRARQDLTENQDGVNGLHQDTVVELVMSYNLYNGGSDSARARQYRERKALAEDQRNIACQNLRQDTTIAYQDVRLLGDQLNSLKAHEEAIGRVRTAAMQQFDIGQRTLLDLLDTENEYFEAQRAHLSSQYDHRLAHLRVARYLGNLPRILGVARSDVPTAAQLGQDRDSVDPAITCQVESPVPYAWAPSAAPAAGAEAAATYSTFIFFDSGKADLSRIARHQLDALVLEILRDESVSKVEVLVEGHTDQVGSVAYNEKLSLSRAEAVADYLVKGGIRQNLIETRALNKGDPLVDDQDATGKAQNRRVKVRLVRQP